MRARYKRTIKLNNSGAKRSRELMYYIRAFVRERAETDYEVDLCLDMVELYADAVLHADKLSSDAKARAKKRRCELS